MPTDYRPTVFLPKTDFPMRGGLPTLEPKLVERWQKMHLYDKLRAAAKGREKFVLHDGPPYANGDLHLGHALNKILKDVINRAQQMLGKDAPYVPGWDCHGLPIEWIVEEQYRAKNQCKDSVPIDQFRRECREFAAHWLEVQKRDSKRLVVVGDWDNPYTTMAYSAQASMTRYGAQTGQAQAAVHGRARSCSLPNPWSRPARQTTASRPIRLSIAFPARALPERRQRIRCVGRATISTSRCWLPV